MGKTYPSLTPELASWLTEQKVFFVSTAPMSGEGHINCSPKGGDTFRVLGEHQVAYLDLTGSGIETTGGLKNQTSIDGLPGYEAGSGRG